jgi:hypothetical protein
LAVADEFADWYVAGPSTPWGASLVTVTRLLARKCQSRAGGQRPASVTTGKWRYHASHREATWAAVDQPPILR